MSDTSVFKARGVCLHAAFSHASSVHGFASSHEVVHVVVVVVELVVVVVVPPDPPVVLVVEDVVSPPPPPLGELVVLPPEFE
ncbi:MAG: hypothetical protein U0441_04535 [Polyangiaceae bacterium]